MLKKIFFFKVTRALKLISDPPRFSCGVTGEELKVEMMLILVMMMVTMMVTMMVIVRIVVTEIIFVFQVSGVITYDECTVNFSDMMNKVTNVQISCILVTIIVIIII